MKIGICGNYGVSNIGDEAILKSLETICKKLNPGAEIIVFGKGMLFPVGFRSFLKSFFAPSLWLRPLRALCACDIFILGGGGLFSDEEGVLIPFFWACQGFLALLLKKPLLCVGISIGRLNFISRAMVRTLLKRARYIIVRDQKSHTLITDWGINAFKTSDLALLLRQSESEPHSETANEKGYIVISTRSFHGLDDFLYKKLALFCDFVSTEFGLQIRLLPFKDGDSNDAQIMNKIFEQAERKDSISIEKFSGDLGRIMGILRNAELVVAMRLHAGILSLITGTPFIPLVYMEKVGDFWLKLDEIPAVHITEKLLDDLVNTFHKVYSNRREQRGLMLSLRNRLASEAEKTEGLLAPFLQK